MRYAHQLLDLGLAAEEVITRIEGVIAYLEEEIAKEDAILKEKGIPIPAEVCCEYSPLSAYH